MGQINRTGTQFDIEEDGRFAKADMMGDKSSDDFSRGHSELSADKIGFPSQVHRPTSRDYMVDVAESFASHNSMFTDHLNQSKRPIFEAHADEEAEH
jgi:hypothetical protein